MKTIIETSHAPTAIGPYSQAVKVDNNAGQTVYCSGQLGINMATGQLADGFEAQATHMFKNIKALVEASGGTLNNVVKITLFLTDMAQFPKVNEIMAQNFTQPYPARSTVGVASLPKGGLVEGEVILVLGQ